MMDTMDIIAALKATIQLSPCVAKDKTMIGTTKNFHRGLPTDPIIKSLPITVDKAMTTAGLSISWVQCA